MVKSGLYCSEQIEIPETFPNILKTYAKAAIRTQPYDLLRWSAAYFRCLANDVPPPVKQRLEKDCRHGSLTKGYLRVLLEQVGRGYFISRRLLQKRWAALCLPEEELLKYLSVCRMLNWPQVHWLKLFAVMVGSLNETPRATFTMICELLTDDVEGGPARIPAWMFRVCYTYLAELDCSEELCFVDGRKKLPNGDLEEETQMGRMPQVFSSTSIRDAIFDRCMQRYNVDCQCQRNTAEACDSSSTAESCPVHGDQETTVSSGFQFFGPINDPTEVLRRYNDFDSLILLLREAQGAKLHQYDGPSKVTGMNIDHSLRREGEILFEREKQHAYHEEASKRFVLQEKINMLRELGPPWTWIQQFATDSCMDKSFNFIETESILSDITPSESSDESFDFCKEKPVVNDDVSVVSTVSKSSSENLSELMKRSESSDEECKKDKTINIVKSILKTAEDQRQIDAKEVASVVTFLCLEEKKVLEAAGEPATGTVNLQEIIAALKVVEERGIVFQTIDEMMDYLKYWKDKSEMYIAPRKEVSAEETPVTGEEEDEIVSEQLEETLEEHKEEESLEEARKEDGSQDVEDDDADNNSAKKDDDAGGKGDDSLKSATSLKTQDADRFSDDLVPTPDASAIDEIREPEPMTQIFAESATLPEEYKMGPDPSCPILGTVPKPEEKEEEPVVVDEQSSITPSGTVSGFGDDSDISSKEPDINFKHRRKLRPYQCPHSESSSSLCSEKEGYCCIVPPYPGIGPSVSKQTMQDFLTYLKARSRCQKGMVMPINFLEPKCPHMVDIGE